MRPNAPPNWYLPSGTSELNAIYGAPPWWPYEDYVPPPPPNWEGESSQDVVEQVGQEPVWSEIE